jgi:hypothetical protein
MSKFNLPGLNILKQIKASTESYSLEESIAVGYDSLETLSGIISFGEDVENQIDSLSLAEKAVLLQQKFHSEALESMVGQISTEGVIADIVNKVAEYLKKLIDWFTALFDHRTKAVTEIQNSFKVFNEYKDKAQYDGTIKLQSVDIGKIMNDQFHNANILDACASIIKQNLASATDKTEEDAISAAVSGFIRGIAGDIGVKHESVERLKEVLSNGGWVVTENSVTPPAKIELVQIEVSTIISEFKKHGETTLAMCTKNSQNLKQTQDELKRLFDELHRNSNDSLTTKRMTSYSHCAMLISKVAQRTVNNEQKLSIALRYLNHLFGPK